MNDVQPAAPGTFAPQRRFLWLDGARGLAAIVVMLYHYEEYLGFKALFRHGFIAVDLFFMLSGFVLSHAYGRRIDEGMGTRRYISARLIRLYPTFLFATLFGFGYYFLKLIMGMDDAPAPTSLAAILGSNLFFLPNLLNIEPQGIFPFSPASWSLSAEMFVSVAFVALIWRLRLNALLALALVSSAVFVAIAIASGTFDLGFDAKTFLVGLLRALCEFSIGVVLYRLAPRLGSVSRLLPPALLAAVMVALILVKPSLFSSFLLIFLVFPLFIGLQPADEPGEPVRTISAELGRLSYPIYLLHTPVLLWGAGLYKFIVGADPARAGPVFGLTLAAASILLSWGCAKFYDEPVRALLNKWTRSRTGRKEKLQG